MHVAQVSAAGQFLATDIDFRLDFGKSGSLFISGSLLALACAQVLMFRRIPVMHGRPAIDGIAHTRVSCWSILGKMQIDFAHGSDCQSSVGGKCVMALWHDVVRPQINCD